MIYIMKGLKLVLISSINFLINEKKLIFMSKYS
jgi:hypothetical protein